MTPRCPLMAAGRLALVTDAVDERIGLLPACGEDAEDLPACLGSDCALWVPYYDAGEDRGHCGLASTNWTFINPASPTPTKKKETP